MSRILIVGGGFGGLHAALSAKLAAGDEVEVILLSRDPHIVIRPRLYEADPLSMRADLLKPLETAGIGFVQGEARDIDTDARTITTADGQILPYDQVVIATGSVMPLPPIPGAETAFTIDTAEAADAFEQRLRQMKGMSAPTLVVIGAGFVGLELVTELRDRLKAIAGSETAQAARLILMDRANAVGPELGTGPRAVIEDALVAARVDVRLGCNIAGISASAVELEGDEQVAADAVILCTGLKAAPFSAKLKGQRDSLGRVCLDAHLRVPQEPHVFVAGDAGVADTSPGRPTLMACQHAVGMGRFAGANAARELEGAPLLAYDQKRYVTCLDLGQSGAVLTEGWEREVVLTGADAKALKRQINTEWIYPPTGDRNAVLAAGDPSLPVVA